LLTHIEIFMKVFTCQMLDVKADGQHARKPIFNLFLQGFVLIRIVAVAEHSGCFQLLVFVLDDVDSAESNHATEEGGEQKFIFEKISKMLTFERAKI